MKSHLPIHPFNTLALSLSGGGYRAASFHLGLLTYLDRIQWDGTSLLSRVRVISTVSGGTFTGVCYTSSIARGETLEQCYEKLFRFMSEVDLIREALKKLSEYDDWNSTKVRSLINAFSLVYFEKLEQETFALLFDKPAHITEAIFNATEFSYGLPFRFQKCQVKDNEALFAFLGNRQVNMPPAAIREVRLSDVIAASSCFPMGFEPINFPTDFRHGNSPVLDTLRESWHTDIWGNKSQFPIGLMDGGIVDNQGIDSVVWAEQRMRREYEGEMKKLVSDDEKAIDLYIISDVASPFMEGYVRTEEKPVKSWRNLSLKSFGWFGALLLLAGGAATWLGLEFASRGWMYLIGAAAGLMFLGGIVSLLLSNLLRIIMKGMQVPEFFIQHLKRFNTMKFGIYETLLKNRISSVISMVSEVFMKQIRRREYGLVYDEESGWTTRLITNAIYELTPQQTTVRNEEKQHILSKELKNVSPALMAAAEKAKSMGTTLWFTPEELKDEKHNMLRTLIAAGQFTACFNLLEYIEKVLWSKDHATEYNRYTPEQKSAINELYIKMLDDWKRFNEEPLWMVK